MVGYDQLFYYEDFYLDEDLFYYLDDADFGTTLIGSDLCNAYGKYSEYLRYAGGVYGGGFSY